MSERLVDRRKALQAIGLAGAAGALAGPALFTGEAGAQSAAAPKQEEPPAPPPPAAEEKKEPSAEAERLGEIAKARYGQHLNEEQLRLLVDDLDDGLRSGERLRKLGLSNADEPDFVFRAEP